MSLVLIFFLFCVMLSTIVSNADAVDGVLNSWSTVTSDINAVNDKGSTLLHTAAVEGNTAMVELLLKAGIDPNFKNTNGNTALMLAAFKGHVGIVSVLAGEQGAAAGVDVNLGRDDGVTPIIAAAWQGRADVVKVLIDTPTCSIDAQQSAGATALVMAAQMGHLEVVELLLSAGSNPNLARNDGATPLHMACEKGHVSVARVLVDADAILGAVHTPTGNTPLHAACKQGHEQVVKVLLSKAPPLQVTNVDGRTPIELAQSHGGFTDQALLQWLREGRGTGDIVLKAGSRN